MRKLWQSLLVALAMAGPGLAQEELICRTALGWCATAMSSAGQRCLCQHDDEPLLGQATFPAAQNPLARLQSADEGDFRSLPVLTRASRVFAGPDHYPPADFRAYGMVIFPRKASRFDEDRHLMFCEAYVNAMAAAEELSIPPDQQMVTIWPLAGNRMAEEINRLPTDQACAPAVANYGLVMAQNALAILKTYGGANGPYDPHGPGPFLVAWTPGSGIAAPGTVALVVDLSDVTEPQDAARQFSLWREKIQNDPTLWATAPEKPTLVERLRRFFDRHGQVLVGLGKP